MLSPKRDGGDHDSKNCSHYNRPTDPHRHLKNDGCIKEPFGKRDTGQERCDSMIVSSPARTAISRHGQLQYEQDRDSSREGIDEQGISEGTPTDNGEEHRSQH